MISAGLERWRRFTEKTFPERHIYIRSTRDTRGLVLTTSRQLTIVAAIGGIVFWAGLTTVGMMAAALTAHASIRQAQRTKATYAGLLAKHDAKLIAAVDRLAQNRADRLRAALRQVGVNPDAVSGAQPVKPGGQGGPFIDANDPAAVAAMANVGRQIAGPVMRAANDVSNMRILAQASSALPLGKPTNTTAQSSGFGVRPDPFTGRSAFHAGLDFPAPIMTPIYATAPGVVSFTGQRAGYGLTVEIDHGGGFKTRFGHLAALSVKIGQKVGAHQNIGSMGSSGRSTGPHLHYEVWKDGRPQDPSSFLKAGDYVQQAG
jgi:murein DD-endopeptidase MepM/ murein hydrolase activator NlpD